MFAVMFGGYCAKLKNIWIADGFHQSLGGLGQICATGCRAFGNSYTLSSLSKIRNSFSYKYLDFIIRQLFLNFIIFFEKISSR